MTETLQQISRREFLKRTGLGAAVVSLASPLFSSCTTLQDSLYNRLKPAPRVEVHLTSRGIVFLIENEAGKFDTYKIVRDTLETDMHVASRFYGNKAIIMIDYQEGEKNIREGLDEVIMMEIKGWTEWIDRTVSGLILKYPLGPVIERFCPGGSEFKEYEKIFKDIQGRGKIDLY